MFDHFFWSHQKGGYPQVNPRGPPCSAPTVKDCQVLVGPLVIFLGFQTNFLGLFQVMIMANPDPVILFFLMYRDLLGIIGLHSLKLTATN